MMLRREEQVLKEHRTAKNTRGIQPF